MICSPIHLDFIMWGNVNIGRLFLKFRLCRDNAIKAGCLGHGVRTGVGGCSHIVWLMIFIFLGFFFFFPFSSPDFALFLAKEHYFSLNCSLWWQFHRQAQKAVVTGRAVLSLNTLLLNFSQFHLGILRSLLVFIQKTFYVRVL